MKIQDAVKQAIKESRTTQTQLAKILGYSSQSGIASRINSKNMNVDTVLRMVEAIGYELVLQPVKRGKRPESQILVERDDNE